MTAPDLLARADEAAAAIRGALGAFPPIAVVLGSGLGELADRLEAPSALGYDQIPWFPRPTVAGHRGSLVVGGICSARVAALQGRFHYYEGHDLDAVTFPVRVLRRLGVRTVILTAAVGGIAEGLGPGSIVAVSDHLNLIGASPLRGPNDDRLGPRFPDLGAVYPERLRTLAAAEAARLGIPLASGVYAAMPGPAYETPAEVRMLRTLGADVVGMSTVPEAIAARHAGIDVLALALVSNRAAGLSSGPISHEDVLAAGRAAGSRLAALIAAVVARLAEEDTAPIT